MIAAEWHPLPGVRAFSTSRAGGTSVAPWSSLNVGDHVGDAADAVVENRRLLLQAGRLPAAPCWLKQVHGIAVVQAGEQAESSPPVADAAISFLAGRVCAVMTADCLPVLLAAGDGSAVGAAHAGWRGLAAGVIEATVRAMRARLPPGMALQAWLGPAISAAHFEVGEEVRAAFLAIDQRAATAFHPGAQGRWACDLYALARQRLAALGIEAVGGGGFCTYADEARFFSHRRDVQHRGLPGTGRMATLIWRT